MLEANFCLLGKVALDFPPTPLFFFLARGGEALPSSASLGWDAVRSSECLSAGYRNRDRYTGLVGGGGRESNRDCCSGPAAAGLKEALGAQNSWPGVDFELLSST